MALSIPSKPKTFAPNVPPPGYRASYVSFASSRKRITPKVQLIHTNGGASQSNIENAKAWSERRTYNGTATTLPTFQVDMDGDAAQFIDSNQAQNACYKVNGWAISYETADKGYKTDSYPAGSYFTEAQLQALANGVAYCSVLYKIPLFYPKTWDGPGTASHTEPFGYPYWTNSRGKACPGDRKKVQVRDIIIPHAIKIVQAWQGTTTTPPPTTSTGKYTVKSGDSWWSISQQYGITVDQLVAMNPPKTSSSVIHPGDVLNVPGSTSKPPPSTGKAPNGLTAEQNVAAGGKATSPPPSPVIRNTLVHVNSPWLQQVLCSMPKLSADGGGPIFPPSKVGEGRVGAGPTTFQMFGDTGHDALAYWQSKNGLTADGVYGSVTASKMRAIRGK